MRAKKIFEDEEFKFMKGPSKEKILKGLEDKDIDQKFVYGIKNNQLWLVKWCVENGLDTNDYYILRFSGSLKRKDGHYEKSYEYYIKNDYLNLNGININLEIVDYLNEYLKIKTAE